MKNACESYLIVVNTVQAELSGSVNALRYKYADIFEPSVGLSSDTGIEHVIALIPDAQAVPQRIYCLAPAEVTEAKAKSLMLERGLIEPTPQPI